MILMTLLDFRVSNKTLKLMSILPYSKCTWYDQSKYLNVSSSPQVWNHSIPDIKEKYNHHNRKPPLELIPGTEPSLTQNLGCSVGVAAKSMRTPRILPDNTKATHAAKRFLRTHAIIHKIRRPIHAPTRILPAVCTASKRPRGGVTCKWVRGSFKLRWLPGVHVSRWATWVAIHCICSDFIRTYVPAFRDVVNIVRDLAGSQCSVRTYWCGTCFNLTGKPTRK